MIKKLFAVNFLFFVLLFGGVTEVQAEEYSVDYDGATYTYSDAGVLVSVENAIGAVDLSAICKENNITLKSIGQNAFCYNSITSVNIPASVKIIDTFAFYECGNLTTVTYEEGSLLTAIGEAAFALDESLCGFYQKGIDGTGTFDFPAGLNSIADLAFECTSPQKVIIPEQCLKIGTSAFAYTEIDSVTIYNNNIVIGEDAFSNTTIIYANPDSKAARYADENELVCRPIPDGGNDSDDIGGDDNNKTSQAGNGEIDGDKTQSGKDDSETSQDGNGKTDGDKTQSGKDNNETSQTGNEVTGGDKQQISDGGSQQQNNNPVININVENHNTQTVTPPTPVVSAEPSKDVSGNTPDGSVQEESPVVYEKTGSKHTVNGLSYKVTGQGTVSFVKPKNKKIKKLIVPDTVTIKGVEYRVTEVATKACYKFKNLETVKIGNYVTVVRKQAFQECKKLKKVTFGRYLKTIEAKCFYKDKKLKKMDMSVCFDFKKAGAHCIKTGSHPDIIRPHDPSYEKKFYVIFKNKEK